MTKRIHARVIAIMIRKHILRLEPSREIKGTFVFKWLCVNKSRERSLRGINHLRIVVNREVRDEHFTTPRLNLIRGVYEKSDLLKPKSKYSEYLKLRGIFNIVYGTSMHRRTNEKKVTTLRC